MSQASAAQVDWEAARARARETLVGLADVAASYTDFQFKRTCPLCANVTVWYDEEGREDAKNVMKQHVVTCFGRFTKKESE